MIRHDKTLSNAELRGQMRRQSIQAHRRILNQFEQPYELPSDRFEEELAQGCLRETEQFGGAG